MKHETLFLITFFISFLLGQQIDLPRIEAMPDFPQPYEMRNWKQVAKGYDTLVFDLNKTGDYLPLIWTDGNGVNYPGHNRFGLHTAVGNASAEAINILPAVLSASLVGVDKSNQNGFNWVLMCEEFFNKSNGENIYLNNFVGSSGNDWWYDTMPNLYFYMLYDLYGSIGDFDYQFITIADRWLEAVRTMQGSTTPWTVPYMNYRGWKMATMQPNTAGVRQPEAAGAIAWILYHAFKKSGEEKYRIGAEWCLEFLNTRTDNPAYELQLPFGIYTAARMNAETGTDYDIEKMLNWCFDPDDNVRNWGVCLGNWGGYDCDGLVGEAKYDGYAFFMNGADQFGALIPIVRYDNRFARTIGKWALNVANASRLFYTNYLPDSNQDGESWAHQYDSNSYIAHEAIREYALNSGISPYATGDFIRSGWGPSNYVLYGSSHVGMFGGIIDTTNVPGILQLDLCKTDFYNNSPYQSFLYYNPHGTTKNIEIEAGWRMVDLYDAVSNEIIATNISGIGSFSVPAKEARIIVLLPEGAEIDFQLDKAVIGDEIIDYSSGKQVANFPPRIKSLATRTTDIPVEEQITFYCTAVDREDKDLRYTWIVGKDTLEETNSTLNWTASSQTGLKKIVTLVHDSQNEEATDSIIIQVLENVNHSPVINNMEVETGKIEPEASTVIICHASDEDQDSLIYNWSVTGGAIDSQDSLATWTAPNQEDNYTIYCRINDGHGGSATDSVTILVRNETNDQAHPLVYLPFSGNAEDFSGYNHHSVVNGATLCDDRNGKAKSAYYFDGTEDNISIANSSNLNFQKAITVCFWMKIEELLNRESFLISHGSWENRWKISIIPEHKLRWTIKTSSGVIDLDSFSKMAKNNWYHIVTLYDGDNLKIYIDGEINSQTSFSGDILKTTFDLTIAQILPGNTAYNFQGIIDDVRIFDTAISQDQIREIFSNANAIDDLDKQPVPDNFYLYQNYPNPFNPETVIKYSLPEETHVNLSIFDISGKLISNLVNKRQRAGEYSVKWIDNNISSGVYFYKLKTANYTSVKKCIKLK